MYLMSIGTANCYVKPSCMALALLDIVYLVCSVMISLVDLIATLVTSRSAPLTRNMVQFAYWKMKTTEIM